MRHRIGYNRLGRNVSHRQALYRSMATALFKYERIRTTKPKAKEIRRVAEKMISRARTDSVHNRRIVGKRIKDKAVLAKLFTDIGPRFTNRPGGYTRILKLGQRYGDASEMVLLELVERMEAPPRRRKKEPAQSEAEAPKDKEAPAAEAEESGSKAPPKESRSSGRSRAAASTAKSAGKTSGEGGAAAAKSAKAKAPEAAAGSAKKASPEAAPKAAAGEAGAGAPQDAEADAAESPEVAAPSEPREDT
jgi:large subunit ribosomal protein L17